MTIAVLGAGLWGRALATIVEEAGHSVVLWDRGIPFTPFCHQIIVAVPAQNVREAVSVFKENHLFIVASKGIEEETALLMTQVIQQVCPDASTAVLSGPNFAYEVMKKLPAATTIACTLKDWPLVSALFSTHWFRPYHTEDQIGVQLGGALKNVIAIASGIAKGLDLGENAQASLLTRGLVEMVRLGQALGANPETFYGLSGVGDLALTAMGSRSRNLSFGEAIARGESMPDITIEGRHTAKSIHTLAQKHRLSLPIFHAVYQILYENLNPSAVLKDLLMRPLKAESL